MKTSIFITLISLFSTVSYAGEYYKCTGKMNKKNASIEIAFESLKSTVVTTEDNEYELDYNRKNSKYMYFADYYIDGYGGSVVLVVPGSFKISGSSTVEEFNTKFTIEMYSEVGHYGTDIFIGKCQRINN